MWPMLASMAVTTALSMKREKDKQKAIAAHNRAQAELTRYSPWTGMKGELQVNSPDYLGAGVQGAMSGAMIGNALGAGGTSGTQLTEAEQRAVDQAVGGMGAQAGNQGQWSSMNWQQYQNETPYA